MAANAVVVGYVLGGNSSPRFDDLNSLTMED